MGNAEYMGDGDSTQDQAHILRREAAGLWWSDQACVPQEGQDHKEDCSAIGVCGVQVQEPRCSQARKALRADRCSQGWQEGKELDPPFVGLQPSMQRIRGSCSTQCGVPAQSEELLLRPDT